MADTEKREEEGQPTEQQEFAAQEAGTGAQVGASPEEEEEQVEGDEGGLFLGYKFSVNTDTYGPVKGEIYYIDDTIIRVKPDGVSNILYDFPLLDGAFNDEAVDFLSQPEVEPTDFPRNFVMTYQFEVGQEWSGYKSGQEGVVGIYQVTDVNNEEDKLVLKLKGGDEHEVRLDLDGKGIPRDTEFDILVRHSVPEEVKEKTPEELAESARQREQEETVGGDAAAAFGEEDEETFEVEDLVPFGAAQAAEAEFENYKPVTSASQVFDDIDQKSDMLTDLLSLYDQASQLDPKVIRSTTIFLELMNNLKNLVVERDEDGMPTGSVKLSYEYLADILQQNNVPLAKPVLDTMRVLMTQSADEESLSLDQVHILNFFKQVDNSNELLEKGMEFTEVNPTDPPFFYRVLTEYFRNFPLGDSYESSREHDYKFDTDAEYFRKQPPGSQPLLGMKKPTVFTNKKDMVMYKGFNTAQFVEEIGMSMRRGLGPSEYPLPAGGVGIYKQSESSKLLGHVLFPYKAVLKGRLGTTRTGQLWQDIYRSLSDLEWMDTILKSLGGISQKPDAVKPTYYATTSAEMQGITFDKYLESILSAITARGYGDLFTLQRDLGIPNVEFTPAQLDILQTHIKKVIGTIIKTIVEKRRQLEAAIPAPKVSPLLESGAAERLKDVLLSDSILRQQLNHLNIYTPWYGRVDIAKVAYLLLKAQDLMLAVLGKQGPHIDREITQFKREQDLLQKYYNRQFSELQAMKGAPPDVNPCVHVNDIEQARKQQDPADRLGLLNKLVSEYQNTRDGDWWTCNRCTKHLICNHEYLQIRQYLSPDKADILEKEIVLNYAGGTFGVHHICKNCGLPIAEVGYDTNIERDDNGNPMMGRAVLVDNDAKQQEAIQQLLQPQVGEEEAEMVFKGDKKIAYNILKVLARGAYLPLEKKHVIQLVDDISIHMSEVFEGKIDKDAEKNAKLKLAFSRLATGFSKLLIFLQTAKEDIIPQRLIQGCKAGFGGFPISTEDINAIDTQEKSIGVYYLLCTMLNSFTHIKKDTRDEPWKTLNIVIKNPVVKQDVLQRLLKSFIKQSFARDLTLPIVQRRLQEKREYRPDLVTGYRNEQIPDGFLPKQQTAQEAKEASAESATVPEGRRANASGETALADAWIKGANEIARAKTDSIKNTPYMEQSCCKSDIKTPGQFWLEQSSLPPIPKSKPLEPFYLRGTYGYVPFEPKALKQSKTELNKENAYQIYLYLCAGDPATNPHYARPHELGPDRICDWCGLEIPEEFLYPDVKKSGELNINNAEIKANLSAKGIPVDDIDKTEALLQASKRLNIFEPYEKPPLPTDILGRFLSMKYAVFPAFSAPSVNEDGSEGVKDVASFPDLLGDVLQGLKTLGDAPNLSEIAVKMAPLTDILDTLEDGLTPEGVTRDESPYTEFLKRFIGKDSDKRRQIDYSLFRTLLYTYFLVPSERMIADFNKEYHSTVPKHFELIDEHRKALQKVLEAHFAYLTSETLEREGRVSKKLAIFVQRLHDIFEITSELTTDRVQLAGLSRDAKFELIRQIYRACFLGPIACLLDAITDDDAGDDVDEEEEAILGDFFGQILDLALKEQKVYNSALIKKKLAELKEKENNIFTRLLDPLSDEDRRRELMMKRAGIGTNLWDWAAGTKRGYKDLYSQAEKLKDSGLGEISEEAEDVFEGGFAGDDDFDEDGEGEENDVNMDGGGYDGGGDGNAEEEH